MNPQLAPKLRSRTYLDEVVTVGYCTLRIASMVPGLKCAPVSTLVPAHIGKTGKGMSTKVSDLSTACVCQTCHDLLDGRDHRWQWLADHYPVAVAWRAVESITETQSHMLAKGVITVPGELI